MSAAETAAVLLVGTRKGLFRAEADAPRRRWRVEGPSLEGREVFHAVFDPARSGRAYAATYHDVWGSHLYRSRDAGRTWRPLPSGPAFPEEGADGERRVRRLWHLAADAEGRLWAGVEPACLFLSEDEGESWRHLPGLEAHPTRAAWGPAKGGLFLHSIQVDPREPVRLYVAVSAGGCYRTEDGGATWRPINRGIRADYLADPEAEAGHNPHALRLHPARPDRLFRQDHAGVYRSDDRGESWTEITAGLPADFGYVVGLDPTDPDRCWVIPEESGHMRCVCDGRLRVYETRDGGRSWSARTGGLPQERAYVSVLREAMATDGLRPCGVHFGTSTGHLFASPDGRRWTLVEGFLPTILSVTCP